MSTRTLRRLETHEALLDATHDSPFVRWDIPRPLAAPAHALGDAVAVLRRTHTRRLGLLVMGPPRDAGDLVAALRAHGLLPDDLRGVTVSRNAIDAVAPHFDFPDGSEWEWMCTSAEPPAVAGERRLEPLHADDRPAIERLLAEHNPGTDARPFAFPGQHWVGAWSDGELVACGVREPNLAGVPILSGITVAASHRGRGLGLAVTAHLTRAAVREHGVCTLGMYSHNAIARRTYTGLGYGDVHEWSSRRLASTPARG